MLFIPGFVLWIWEKKDPSQEIKYSDEVLKESKNATIIMLYVIIIAHILFYFAKPSYSPITDRSSRLDKDCVYAPIYKNYYCHFFKRV